MRAHRILFCLLLVVALPAQAQDRIRSISQRYAFDPDGEVDLTTYKGSISVLPWDRAEVQVEVQIEAENIDALIMLPEVEIQIGGSERHLEIETDYRRAIQRLQALFEEAEASRLPLVHYVLRMPRTAHLRIEDYMSSTSVEDFQATLEVYTYKGLIEVTNFGGALKLDTFKGTAHVSFLRLIRDSSIESYEGEVAVLLPPEAAFDLNVDLGAPQALFTPDSSFFVLPRSFESWPLHKPVLHEQNYSGPVNGGGPHLSLVTHSGALRLSTY